MIGYTNTRYIHLEYWLFKKEVPGRDAAKMLKGQRMRQISHIRQLRAQLLQRTQ